MLKTRMITALGLLCLMMTALWVFSPFAWASFAWLMIGLALWEYTRMVRMARPIQWLYLMGSTAVAGLCWAMHVVLPPVGHMIVLVFWLVLLPCWLARRWRLGQGWLVSGLLGWLLMFPAWFALIEWRERAESAFALNLLALMGLVWVADITAYFVGRSFGRRKLAPAISPGKSWEGVYGSVIAVALYCYLVAQLGWMTLAVPSGWLMLLGLSLAAVSVMGDLLESWLKRQAGLKDSSGLLPGHGGVYDRIDSLIAVLAVSNAFRVLGGL